MPEGDLSSWLWKARVKTARALLGNAPSEFQLDDFDWTRYHLEYSKQLAAQESEVRLRLEDEDYVLEGGKLVRKRSPLPLHPNHLLLYELVIELSPTSILEVGCGGGDHLRNLSILDPSLEIRGVDRSEGQLRTLAERNPMVVTKASVLDISSAHVDAQLAADLVYTQAVLMHIQTRSSYERALANVFSLASEHVVLVENWHRHNFVEDISRLSSSGALGWDQVRLYVVEGTGSSTALVASRHELPWRPAASTKDLTGL